MRPIERGLMFCILGMLLWAVWIFSGLNDAWLLPAALAGAVILPLAFIHSGRCGAISIPRDPVFWAGALFLAYLTLQWWNAGRTMFFDVGFKRWEFAPPRHPTWPWAFDRNDAAQIVLWFAPAWSLAVALRSPGFSFQAAGVLLRGLVYSAGLLALLGVVQFATHTKEMYWAVPMKSPEFFASFGYTNHAAAYFVLMGAVAAGLLYREVLHPADKPRRGRILLLTSSLVLCLIGANLSLSRAGVILAWALAGFITCYGLTKGWRRLRPAARLNLAVATLVAGAIFFFAVVGTGDRAIQKEFAVDRPTAINSIPGLECLNLSMEPRWDLDIVAWQIWKDYPAFGVGGWGFRRLLAFYTPPEYWEGLVKQPGRANVHCDVLQFLAEFGIVGCGLGGVGLGALLWPLYRLPIRQSSVGMLGIVGLALVVVFSLIDLPFRCPAILWTWTAVAAVLPKLVVHLETTP